MMHRCLLAGLLFVTTAFPALADYATGAAAYSDGDYQTAHTEFLESANAGDPRAEFGLGVMFHKGRGVKVDYAKAVEWYTKAAMQGHSTAQNNLGVMYRRGEGVKKDPNEAFTWIWMAAMQGDRRAQMNLSDMFWHGDGVSKDLVQAYVWLEFPVTDLPPSGRDVAVSRRNEIIAQLSDEQLIRAERMAKALREAQE